MTKAWGMSVLCLGSEPGLHTTCPCDLKPSAHPLDRPQRKGGHHEQGAHGTVGTPQNPLNASLLPHSWHEYHTIY